MTIAKLPCFIVVILLKGWIFNNLPFHLLHFNAEFKRRFIEIFINNLSVYTVHIDESWPVKIWRITDK